MPPRNKLLDQSPLLVSGLVVALSGCSKDLVEALPDATVFDPDAAVYGCSAEGARAHTIFLNRLGGAYTTNGRDEGSPSLNRSIILQTSVTLEPAGINDTDWEEIISCVGAMLEPYDVAVTDIDPAPSGMLIEHQEIVILKDSSEIGYDQPLGWISPTGCATRVDGIAFVFADWVGPEDSNRDICESVLQSIGPMVGIDSVSECSDVFSQLPRCGDKGITNAEVQCGRFDAQDCMCTGLATQNPHQGLVRAYGSCEG